MTGRDEAGRFLPGNRIWEARSSAGPKPKFSDPDKLWAACVEYFEWVEAHPLHEAKAFSYEGVVKIEALPKMQAMTITGLCLFLDVSVQAWHNWRSDRPDLIEVITRAESVIYQQKFAGAAAELLNPNIIARDLGLADKKEHSGPNGGPIQTEDVSTDANSFTGRILRLAARAAEAGGTGEADGGGEGQS